MSSLADSGPRLHVVTLTPFFPSQQNEVNGCFIAEPISRLHQYAVDSTVIAVAPIYYPRNHPSSLAPAKWIRYPRIPKNFGLSSAGTFLYARLLHEMQKLHRTNPIDVIHAHGGLPCGDAARLLSRRLNIPFLVSVHGLDVFNTCELDGAPAKWRRDKSIAVYQSARTVICVSKKVQQILCSGMPAHIRSAVVYNGADPKLFSPSVAPASIADIPPTATPPENEILIVGNLIPSKGHELVLRAMRHLASVLPRCQIFGEGPERPRLEALATELGLAQRVKFVGRQSRAAVAAAMRACSVFALPSRSEGLGCVYLEAMACGKPVIACRGQGIDEIIQHEKNGWLIPVDGLHELTQGLSTLLQSPDLSARIGKAARETILNGLTISDQARHLATVYREAIGLQIPQEI